MPTEQQTLAGRLRAAPAEFRAAVISLDDRALRHCPAEGEWSAIEVLGHIIDKMGAWTGRVERIASEDYPLLRSYDQDAYVREHRYQQRALEGMLDELTQACNHFAKVVEQLPDAALNRLGKHEEVGPMTLRECIVAPLDSLPGHLAQLRAAAQG